MSVTQFVRMAALVLVVTLSVAPMRAQASTPQWIYSTGDDFGYSAAEASWLYFQSDEIMWMYNFNTGQWVEDPGIGWIWFQWPYLYSIPANAWFYVAAPAGGLWIYHFQAGQWTRLP